MPRASTHIFRVRLWPKVYRDVEIDSRKSLYDLAAAIVRAFGFDFDHAFGFFSKLTGHIYDSPARYELFADLDDVPFAVCATSPAGGRPPPRRSGPATARREA